MQIVDKEKASAHDTLTFGPFRFVPTSRFLEQSGVAVPLGGRALEILIVLVERAGEIVSKRDLISRVWPDVTIDEGSLRFHIAVLRKALGDGEAGARYITNVPGRGYCFVAPISRSATLDRSDGTSDFYRGHNLPFRMTRIVGRDEAVRTISTRLLADRFITIVGPGGIGKTTVAASVAHALLAEFRGEIRFIDLGTINSSRLVASALSSALGLSVSSEDPITDLIAFLQDKRIMLVLDSCEHVIEAMAPIGERIFLNAPQVHLLATSQEALRVEGEHVHRLFALDYPPDAHRLTAAEALDFPAVQLFVERISANINDFELRDEDAPVIAEICRKLDGIALALELAAGRVAVYGIKGTASLLDDGFRLLWRGRRTAAPRHQTLNATFDWSYNLLDDIERVILRRLSVLVGKFTLEAAQSIAAAEQTERSKFAEGMAGLVEKSIISADGDGDQLRYRLLDMTRAYAMEKLIQSGELETTSRHHALFYCRALNSTDGKVPKSKAQEIATYEEYLANVRAALEWSFSDRGDSAVGVSLAAAAGPLLMVAMSLLTECRRWMERAIAALDDKNRGTRQELEIQAYLGLSLLFTTGGTESVRTALARGLEVATVLNDPWQQLRLINCLHIFMSKTGNWSGALELARRSQSIGISMENSKAVAMGDSLLAADYHMIGDQASARIHIEAALASASPENRLTLTNIDFSSRATDFCTLARILWLQGNPYQARVFARRAIEDAESRISPLIICNLSLAMLPIFINIGDYPSAVEFVDRMAAVADSRRLLSYRSLALAVRGQLHVKHGEIELGIGLLRSCLESFPPNSHETLTSMLPCALADGLAKMGKLEEALAKIDELISEVRGSGALFALPEMLRIKGEILAEMSESNILTSEACFLQSLDSARSQSAFFWELRSATSLARFWCRQSRISEARDVLEAVHSRVDRQFETPDIKAAQTLLETMRQ